MTATDDVMAAVLCSRGGVAGKRGLAVVRMHVHRLRPCLVILFLSVIYFQPDEWTEMQSG